MAHSVERPGTRPAHEDVRFKARDSLPITSSAALPAILLLSGMLSWLPELMAMQLAIGTVVARFLALGIVVAWEPGSARIPISALLSGIGLAITGIAIAIGKTLLTH